MKRNILFIGAGKLGTTLAWALSQNGFLIPIFYSTEFPENKSDYLPDTEFIGKLSEESVGKCKILIITVPDAQIIEVAKQLELLKVNWENKLVIHTSGCLSSNELHQLKLKGALVGSIHPMQTFDNFFLKIDLCISSVISSTGSPSTSNCA